jgi:hypothetical protein
MSAQKITNHRNPGCRRRLFRFTLILIAVALLYVPTSAYASGWNQLELSGPGSTSSTGRIAAVSRSKNHMEVFWVWLL